MSYILYHQSIEGATLTYSATEDTNYPDTNMQDRYINTFMKDTAIGADDITLEIDFGSARNCDYILLGNYIATAGTTCLLDLDGSATGAFGGEETNIFTGTSINSATLTNKLITAGFDSGGESFQYWLLTFNDVDNVSVTDLQIGTIYLGLKITLSHSPQPEIGESNDYLVNTNQGVGGIRAGSIDNTDLRRLWSYPWKYLNETDKTNLETFRDSIFMNKGFSRYPFYWTPDTGTTLYYSRTRGELNLFQMAFEAWQWNANFEEEL